MPTNNKRATRRSHQPQSGITHASKTTEVVASPVNMYVAPDIQKSELLRSLEAFAPTAADMTKTMKEKEAQVAEAQRQGMSNEEANAYIDSPEFQQKDGAFRRSFMLQSGKMDGRAYRDSVTQGYDTDYNPDSEALDAFKKRYAPTPRTEDTDYLAGFNHYAGQGLEAVDSAHQKYEVTQAKTKMADAVYQDSTEFLQEALDNGQSTITPLTLQMIKEDGEVIGLSKKESEIKVLDAVDTMALEGRPDLYNIFYEKRTDGSPGLAMTAEYGERIAKSKLAAQRIKDSAETKATEQAKFEARMRLSERAKNGTLTQFDANKEVDIVGAGTAASYYEQSEKRRIEIEDLNKVANAMRKGSGMTVNDSKYAQPAFDQVATEELQDAQGDPTAVAKVVSLGIKNGMIYTPWKNVLEGANPENPQQFQSIVDLYNNIAASNPAYANQLVKENQRILFETYTASLESGGTAEQALQNTKILGTPDEESRANMYLQGAAGKELLTTIDDQLEVDKDFFWNFGDVDLADSNQPYVRSAVRRGVNLRIRMGQTPKASVTNAIQHFKDSHALVKDKYVYIGKNPITEDMTEKMEKFLDEDYVTYRKDKKLDVDPSGYHVMSDARTPIDGLVTIYDSKGWPQGKRTSFRNIVKHYATSQAEQVKTDTLTEQQRQRTNRATDERVKQNLEGTPSAL